MHAGVRLINQHFKDKYLPAEPQTLLDVGSYDVNGNIRDIYEGYEYTGIDLRDGPNVDIVVEDGDWNLPQQYDVVVCNSVLEHVAFMWKTVRQMVEACKVGGWILVTTPSSLGPHDHPKDYWRIMPDGLELLFKMEGGLSVIRECSICPKSSHKDTYAIVHKEG